MYYFSMLLVIISSLFYHIAQKSISHRINPAFSMIVTYGVALGLSVIMYFVFPKNDGESLIKELNWASYVLGIVIVVLEIGFLLVYRSGWNISFAGVFANVFIGVILIPIGMLVYKESISIVNGLGIIMCLIGIILIKK
ncbi:hypothetical protein [Wukongibacter sp. M2B1]|uniref:hypothetical protein n=1 Tax=Wukongibacter sp. M2B1 TaxID=3088895 RepID=UPI003D78F68B